MDVKNLVSEYLKSKLVAGAYTELVDEVVHSARAEIAVMLDILDTDEMSQEFLLEFLGFYGIDVVQNQDGSINRNSIRRYKAMLRKRGELASIMYMIKSGGGLYVETPIDAEVYPFYKVPASLEPNPEDGIIYIRTSDKRILLESLMVDQVTPAGYKYSLTFQNAVGRIQIPSTVSKLQRTKKRERAVGLEATTTKQKKSSLERQVIIPLEVGDLTKGVVWTAAAVYVPINNPPLDLLLHKERNLTLDITIDFTKITPYNRTITTERSTFNEMWSYGSAYRSGETTARIYKQNTTGRTAVQLTKI